MHALLIFYFPINNPANIMHALLIFYFHYTDSCVKLTIPPPPVPPLYTFLYTPTNHPILTTHTLNHSALQEVANPNPNPNPLQEVALNGIGTYGKPGAGLNRAARIKHASDILARELLPHLGVDSAPECMVKKAYFVGYMVNRLLMATLRRRETVCTWGLLMLQQRGIGMHYMFLLFCTPFHTLCRMIVITMATSVSISLAR